MEHSPLASRKRPRDRLSITDYDTGTPELKSRRPSPSPAVSAATTPTVTDSSENLEDLDDDPMIRQLLGDDVFGDWRAYQKEQREAERALERRREQERLDEEYARMLQQELQNDGYASIAPRPPSMNESSQSSNQQIIGSYNGRLTMPPPPPPPPPRPAPSASSRPLIDQQEQFLAGFMPGSFPDSYDLMPNSSSPSTGDSELEEIPASTFRPNNRQPAPYSFSTPSLSTPYNAPGAYPVYQGYGGTSVYNTPYAGSSGAFNPAYEFLDDQINAYGNVPYGFGMPGSGGFLPSAQDLGRLNEIQRSQYDTLYGRLYDNAHDPKQTTEEIKSLFDNIRPDEETEPGDRERTPPGMSVELMEHQKLGLSWMKQMEQSAANRGGILADDMGLGKTVQALALMVSQPSPDRTRKTTLIVAPVALLQQWKREIERLMTTANQLRVYILHAEARHVNWKVLREHDVVLTTYGTLAAEVKRKTAWDDRRERHPTIQPSGREGTFPALGESSLWYRVILDEAQMIKNKNTKSATAVSMLKAEYRWCLTGTPMQNSIAELYSLVKFLGIKPYNHLEKFNREFVKPLVGRGERQEDKEKAMRQLQVLLKAILLRRTKKSKIDGRPLLQLPERTTEQVHALFDEEQMTFYRQQENQTQRDFSRLLNSNSVGRNYSNVLVMLLRLRQACCHPKLIKDHGIEGGADMGDIDLAANAKALSSEVISRLLEMEAFDCPICIDVAEDPVIFYPCGHWSCTECFSRISDPASLALNAVDDGRADVKCPNCRTKVDVRKNTTLQAFREVHGPEAKDTALTAGADDGSETESVYDSDSSTETESEDEGSLEDFVVPDDHPLKFEDDSSDGEGYRKGKTPFEKSGRIKSKKEKKIRKKGHHKSRGKGKEKAREKAPKLLTLAELKKQSSRSKKMKEKYLRKLAEDWKTSAKIDKTMEILNRIEASDTDEKTIIFCSFTSMLDLLEVPISRNGFGYRRYDGSMAPKERNEAVLEFTDKPECKVMLVSLKAGNAGLNLTRASQVIILDPFWNPYVEEQAIDRAHRIGQTRPVIVHRILVPDTVEDRIVEMQEKKRQVIESALDESAGRSVARLSTRELAYLFGVPANGH